MASYSGKRYSGNGIKDRYCGDRSTEIRNHKLDYEETIKASPFSIFHPIADLGCFGWKPNPKIRRMENVTKQELLKSIWLSIQPSRVLPVSELNAKCPLTLGQQRAQNSAVIDTYAPEFVKLYVAREKKFDLKNIDFIFGGSTLDALATRQIQDRDYVVTLLKTTRDTHVIQIANRTLYEANFADPGYQFERFVVGEDLSGKHHTIGIEHLQLLSVGKYTVLFCAESDAIDEDNNMVEVKASNPRYWGTKTMFQMISNGSAVLYHGKRYRRNLQYVVEKSLEQVINEAVQYLEVSSLEENITSAMMTIKKFVNEGNLADGRKFKLVFNDGDIEFKEWKDPIEQSIPEEVQNDLLGI